MRRYTAILLTFAVGLAGPAARAQNPAPLPPPDPAQAALIQMLQEGQQREAAALVRAARAERLLQAVQSRAAELEVKVATCKP